MRTPFIISLAIFANYASAEGRNDPFMRCTFDDGREVIMAENGDDFEWREGDFTGPVTAAQTSAQDPIRTFMGNWDDPERIDVFGGWFSDGNPELEIGSAYLTKTIITAEGRFDTRSTTGKCEAFLG